MIWHDHSHCARSYVTNFVYSSLTKFVLKDELKRKFPFCPLSSIEKYLKINLAACT